MNEAQKVLFRHMASISLIIYLVCTCIFLQRFPTFVKINSFFHAKELNNPGVSKHKFLKASCKKRAWPRRIDSEKEDLFKRKPITWVLKATNL